MLNSPIPFEPIKAALANAIKMPPVLPRNKTTFQVTLTSHQDPTDVRHLTIAQGEPCLIGRASKDETKNLQASPDNALFDCPVVSRAHAELKANPWAAPQDQIVIVDKGSTHGTRVNKTVLQRGIPMALRSGDNLQFGARVTRGDDTHEGVVMTFERILADNIQTQTLRADTQPYKCSGYHLPIESDDEDEEIMSEDDASPHSDISDISDRDSEEEVEVLSSAKTTPEQRKANVGSAERPIDIDSMPPPPPPRVQTVINLLEDDDEVPSVSVLTGVGQRAPPPTPLRPRDDPVVGSYSKPFEGSSKIIPDSLNKNTSLLTPEPPQIFDDFLEADYEDEDEGALRTTGLSGILNEAPSSPSCEEDSDEEREIDYPNDRDVDAEADRRSDSDGSDVGPYSLGEMSEIEEDEAYHKEPSPELGSFDFSLSQNKAPLPSYRPRSPSIPQGTPYTSYPPYSTSFHGATSAYYPRTLPNPIPFVSDWNKPLQSTYTYSHPVSNPSVPGPATDVRDSSRWDVRPSNQTSYSPPLAGLYNASDSSGKLMYWKPSSAQQRDLPVPPAMPTAPQPQQPTGALGGMKHFGFGQPWNNVPEYVPDQDKTKKSGASEFLNIFEADLRKPKATATPGKESEKVEKKNGIEVADLLETAEGAKDTDAHHSSLLTINELTNSISGTKRKVEEMLAESKPNEEQYMVDVDPELPITQDFAESRHKMTTRSQFCAKHGLPPLPPLPPLREDREPPARRRKLNHPTARNTALEVTKYAAGALVGTVGTVAFLCSPLAEKLLDWLA